MGSFGLVEATVSSVQAAFGSGELTARSLVEGYLERIEAFDRSGPGINSVISVSPSVLEEADRLDEVFRVSGPVGPLHGVPVLLKDQIDAVGMPTTLGSVLLRDFVPGRDATVVRMLRDAGALVLAKVTLGELGGGDTHGTLFGSTRNPYDLERTPGGSSGGTGAAVAANLGLVGLGQEGFASIRRPAAWNSIVGLRPTAGLVPRSGVFAGWPGVAGAVGPMARTVEDLARLLEVMVGYDGADPLTALGVPHHRPRPALDGSALEGARIGVLRTTMGQWSEPDTDDFRAIEHAFDGTLAELADAGAQLVDPVELDGLTELLATRVGADRGGGEEAYANYMREVDHPPFGTLGEVLATPDYEPRGIIRAPQPPTPVEHLRAAETLMIELMRVFAEHRLDAIVHRTVEHQPTLIAEGVAPPFTNTKGATHLNTFLVHVPSLSVPSGFLDNGLPVGVTLLGRPYDDWHLIRLAYAYEQATGHRRSPSSTPELS